MPKRWSNTAVLLVSLACAASAQSLDLGGGSAPSVDASTATGELAVFLIAQADEIDARESPTDRLRASAGVRRLAAALLDDASSQSARLAPRSLIARTIVAHLEALDTALASDALPPARAALLAQDCSRLAADLPGRQHELDRALRDAFAPLTIALGVSDSAWFTAGPASAPNTSSLASLAAEPPARMAALAELDLLFIRARAWPSHRASADRAIDLVRAAAPVLSAPAWVDPDVRTALADAFDAAIADLRDPALADDALVGLERLGLAGAFIASVDAIEPVTVRRRARTRSMPLLAAFGSDPERAQRVCRAATETLAVASDADILALEPYLPTFARVAWRAAEAEWKDANTRLIDAMIEQFDAPDPTTEPAFLAAIRAQRQPKRLLEDIAAIGVYLTGVAPHPVDATPRRPAVLRERRLLASRVLALGKAIANTDTRDDAVRQLTDIAALVRASEPLAHEKRLRDLAADEGPGIDALNAATRDRPQRLFDALDELHKQALEQLEMKDPAAPDSSAPEIIARARRLSDLLAAIDAGCIFTAVGRARLDPWAAWELTDRAWAELDDQLPAQLRSATVAALEGQPVNEESFAVVRLAAHYAARLPDPADDTEPAAGALAQFALGVPHAAALAAEHREPLAAICRDLEERTSARLRGENDRVAALGARAARTALRILEVVEARGG